MGRAGEKTADQRDAFLECFNMAVPNIDDSYVHHNEGGGVGVGEAIVRSKRRMLFFNPFGIWLYRWMGVVTLAALYNAFLIIVRETFDKLLNSYLPLWLTLDYIADTVYVLDMAVQLCTSKFPVLLVSSSSPLWGRLLTYVSLGPRRSSGTRTSGDRTKANGPPLCQVHVLQTGPAVSHSF